MQKVLKAKLLFYRIVVKIPSLRLKSRAGPKQTEFANCSVIIWKHVSQCVAYWWTSRGWSTSLIFNMLLYVIIFKGPVCKIQHHLMVRKNTDSSFSLVQYGRHRWTCLLCKSKCLQWVHINTTVIHFWCLNLMTNTRIYYLHHFMLISNVTHWASKPLRQVQWLWGSVQAFFWLASCFELMGKQIF